MTQNKMEAAQKVLALADGRDEDALWAALAGAEAALLQPEDFQPAVYCHVVVAAGVGLERRLGALGRTRRVFALERSVLRLAAAFPPSTTAHNTARMPSNDWRVLRIAFECVAAQIGAQWPMETRQEAMTAVARLGVLLAGLWMLQDRRSNAYKASELLLATARALQRCGDAEHLATEPLFLLAMISMVETGDKAKALELFQSAAAVALPRNSRTDATISRGGAFDYWFAVALLQNGRESEALAALRRCVRANYEPVASLTLAALLHLRDRDFRDAADELQRAMETDFAQFVAMFDYAVLLGRMGNFDAQMQMLEYFCESSGGGDKVPSSGKKRLRDESLAVEAASRLEAVTTTLLDERKLQDLMPGSQSRTSTRTVRLYQALAATENGKWIEAKRFFEEFFAEGAGSGSAAGGANVEECDATRDYIYVLLQSHHFTLALSRADAYLAETGRSYSSAASLALIHLYKADALLCLERVEACHSYLLSVVSPLLTELLPVETSTTGDHKHSAVREEVMQCHAQLLNNLAVATVCQEGVDAGIALLRRAVLQFPDSLQIKFNLVLLLWRVNQKEAACTIWIEARGWNLQMKTDDLPDENQIRRASAMAAGNQQASIAVRATLISEHVSDSQGDCGVSEQQLVYLDALVLDHWRKVRNAKAVESSLLYVQYLKTLIDPPA